MLIDIHGQQEFQSLVSRDAQRHCSSTHGPSASCSSRSPSSRREWRSCTAERESLAAMARDRGARLELLRYQVGELEALGLRAGEAEALFEERLRLANRGRLAEAAQAALAALLRRRRRRRPRARRACGGACARPRRSIARLAETLQLIEESLIALARNGRTTRCLSRRRSMPTRRGTRRVERRLAAIEDLARKHRVEPAELPGTLEDLRIAIAVARTVRIALGGLDERIAGIRTRYDAAARRAVGGATRAARRLGDRRHEPDAPARHARRKIRDRDRDRCRATTRVRWRRSCRVPGERQSGRAAEAGCQSRLGRRTVAHQPRGAGRGGATGTRAPA